MKKALLQQSLGKIEYEIFWYNEDGFPYYSQYMEYNIHCAVQDITVALGSRLRLSRERFIKDVIFLTYFKVSMSYYSHTDAFIKEYMGILNKCVIMLKRWVGKGRCLDAFLGYDFKSVKKRGLCEELNFDAFTCNKDIMLYEIWNLDSYLRLGDEEVLIDSFLSY